MQRTRLNDLLSQVWNAVSPQLQKPWYVNGFRIISLLGGFFSASIFNTFAGQNGIRDSSVSILLLGLIELINWIVYGQVWLSGKFSLNLYKISLLFGLAVEGFKLAS